MIALSRTCMIAMRMISMFRRRERSFSPMRFSPMGFLPMWPLPGRSHTFLRFHIAAELHVNFGNHFVCSHPCLAVDSLDDALETIAGVEVLFGEIHGHCLLFQGDLILEILDKILHPAQLGELSFDVVVLRIYEVVIRGIVLVSGFFWVWQDFPQA